VKVEQNYVRRELTEYLFHVPGIGETSYLERRVGEEFFEQHDILGLVINNQDARTQRSYRVSECARRWRSRLTSESDAVMRIDDPRKSR
jgi:hypothetical protein